MRERLCVVPQAAPLLQQHVEGSKINQITFSGQSGLWSPAPGSLSYSLRFLPSFSQRFFGWLAAPTTSSPFLGRSTQPGWVAQCTSPMKAWLNTSITAGLDSAFHSKGWCLQPPWHHCWPGYLHRSCSQGQALGEGREAPPLGDLAHLWEEGWERCCAVGIHKPMEISQTWLQPMLFFLLRQQKSSIPYFNWNPSRAMMGSMTRAPECCWQDSHKLEVMPMERGPPRLPLTITMLFLALQSTVECKRKKCQKLTCQLCAKRS